MKVRELLGQLVKYNMDADIVVSTGDTFDDVEELDISWGSPYFGDGAEKKDAKIIYINTLHNHEQVSE